jgi:hypothetical protein
MQQEKMKLGCPCEGDEFLVVSNEYARSATLDISTR